MTTLSAAPVRTNGGVGDANHDGNDDPKFLSEPASSNPSKKPRRSTRRTKTTSSTVKGEKGDEPLPKDEEPADISAEDAPSTPTKKKTKAKTKTAKNRGSPRKKKEIPLPGSKDPPKDFEPIYAMVEELREDRSAPVDSNGSEALPQRDRGEKVYRFQVLMALMLSSQTKDQVVGDAIRAMQQHGLDVDNISKTPPEVLNKLIAKVGFHNNKTKYIKEAVEMLLKDFDGDVPKTAEDIMKLPGVGPKMAYIVENVAWGTVSGIGVDTHMHRMFNELRWVSSKNPEQTRIQLESWLPPDKWDTVNILWVGFGQEVQQFKPKMLKKVLACSDPPAALRLVKRLGLDYKKEGAKLGLEDEIKQALATQSVKKEENREEL